MVRRKSLAHYKHRYASMLQTRHALRSYGFFSRVVVIMACGLLVGNIGLGSGMLSHAAALDYAEEAAKSSNFIDLINVQEAYDQGYTGAGITVGVIDSAILPSHSELLGKVRNLDAYYDGVLYEPNWTYDVHGSHVAGIIAAKLDGEGMHGVAYDASIRGMTFLATDSAYVPININPSPDVFSTDFADMRIINNSWGGYWYPYDVATGDDQTTDSVIELSMGIPDDLFTMLVNHALSNKDIVVVFAAGNDGLPTPSIDGMLPRYLGSSLNNWLSVGSLDSACVTVNDDGSLHFADGSVSLFSNLAAGAERFTVFAPGSSIYSLDASSGGYATHSGTSMAAPVVSGALTLVMQKFPWMTGPQLASTIVSTANSNITTDNGCFFQFTTYFDESTGNVSYGFTFNHKENTSYSNDEIKVLLKKAVAANPNAWANTGLTVDNVEYLDMNFVVSSTYASLENVIGQGVLDVAKAMGGMAELDANRMTASSVQDIAELSNAKHAIEVLDTKGYTAVFSNDISGFAWNDMYHHADYQTGGQYNADALALARTLNGTAGGVGNLIGIEKAGDGALILTGHNTYEGATLVTGGILGLMQTSETGSGTLTASDVVVRSGGTFAGDGFVQKSLTNNGIVAAGVLMSPNYGILHGVSANTLTVADYVQGKDGALHIYFDGDGDYGKLDITGTASLDGALRFIAARDFYENNETYTLSKVITGTTSGTFATTGTAPKTSPKTSPDAISSPTLNWAVKDVHTGDYSYAITTNRPDNAYSQYAFNADSRSLGMALAHMANGENLIPLLPDAQNLFTALDFSSPDGGDIERALASLSPATYNKQTQTSLRQQTSLSTTVFSQMLSAHKQGAGPSQAQAHTSGYLASEVGTVYLASNDNYVAPTQTPTWEFWATAIGSYAKQDAHSLASPHGSSTRYGIMVGADRFVNDALRLGFHIIATKSDTEYTGTHNAGTDSSAFSIGMQGVYTFYDINGNSTPSILDGVYVSGLMRAGFEQNEMQRAINSNGYTGYTSSDWLDTSLSAMLAIGKDWNIDKYYIGPFMRLDATYMRRPDIIESGSCTRLHIESDNYVSLPLSLGVHLGGTFETFRGQEVLLDVLLAWQRQLLDDSYENRAHFADLPDYSFTTSDAAEDRDNVTIQASMKCTASESISFQLNAGTTLYNTKDYDLNGGLTVMWTF